MSNTPERDYEGLLETLVNTRVQLGAALASERELQMDCDFFARERDAAEAQRNALAKALRGLMANIEEYRGLRPRPRQGDSALAELLWGEAMVNARETLAMLGMLEDE